MAAKASLRKPEGKKALDYLVNVRKISLEVIEKFDIGFCPENTNHELRSRFITPIYDHYGDLTAISTRHIDKDKSNRFWHESFEKSFYLYGLYYAKNNIIKTDSVVIVEGEFDVSVLHSFGIDTSVSCCGSALNLYQISVLSRYCKNFFLVFDGDEAGRRAIERSLKIYEENYLNVYGLNFIPVFLPKNKDPDEFLLDVGKEGFLEKLKTSQEEKI